MMLSYYNGLRFIWAAYLTQLMMKLTKFSVFCFKKE